MGDYRHSFYSIEDLAGSEKNKKSLRDSVVEFFKKLLTLVDDLND